MANTLEINANEIGLKVGETIVVPVTTTAPNYEFNVDAENIINVKKKKSGLLIKGLVKGAANLIVAAEDAEQVRLVVTVYEETNSGTVHFEGNGGVGEMSDRTVAVDEALSLPSSEFIAPEGKVFIGWSEEKEGGKVLEPNSLLQFHQDGTHTLYAQYEDAPVNPEPTPDPEPDPEPKPEPTPDPEPEEPTKPGELSETEIAALLAKMAVNWELTLDKLSKEANPVYRNLINKLVSFEKKYGKNSISIYNAKEYSGRIFDLYKTILTVLEDSVDNISRVENLLTLYSKFGFKYPETFGSTYLLQEINLWGNEAPFKPTKVDVKTWTNLAKILSDLANEITRPDQLEKIDFDKLIEDKEINVSDKLRSIIIDYYKR